MRLDQIPAGTVFRGKIKGGHYPYRLFVCVQVRVSGGTLDSDRMVYPLDCPSQNPKGLLTWGQSWNAPGCEFEEYQPLEVELRVLGPERKG